MGARAHLHARDVVVPLERGSFFGETRARTTTAHLDVLLKRHESRPGATTPVHSHAPPYLALVTRGALRETCGGVEYACTPGSLALDTVGAEHHDRYESDAVEVINIGFAPSWLESLREEEKRLPAFTWINRRSLPERARTLRAHVERPEPLSALVIEGAAAELLLLVTRTGATHKRGGAAPRWLATVEEALRAEFRRPPSLSDLARLVERSPSQVVRAFRQWRGTTLGSFARRLRAEYARRALFETRASLLEISVDAGYSDKSHMTRELRVHLGCTPGRLRRARDDESGRPA